MSESVIEADIQVLEFYLDDRKYCVDIEHVDEIVDRGNDLTPLPNSAPHVEGIVDLRGTTTTIINPKRVLNIGGESTGERIIVFDPDEEENRTTGWIIDEVNQVARLEGEEVDDSVEGGSVLGIVKRDDGFVIWIDPERINA